MPVVGIDGDPALANAFRDVLPHTRVMEDYRHWKHNVLKVLDGDDQHRLFQHHIQQLVDAPTFAEFDRLAAEAATSMPPKLWKYFKHGEGPAGRSAMQRLRGTPLWPTHPPCVCVFVDVCVCVWVLA